MKKITFLFLFTCISFSSFAQSKHSDPRSMKGPDVSKIRILPSLGDLKSSPDALKKGAVIIGKAEFVTSHISSSQIPSKNIQNPQPANFSLWRVLRASNGTANWMWRASTKPAGIAPQSVSSPDGITILEGLKSALRISDPKSEFYPMSTITDELGCKHLRYGQIYHGIPVWNRDLYIHLDPAGEPYIINGTYEPTPKNVTTVPSLTNPYAIIVAIADLKSRNKWAPVASDVATVLGYDEPSATLVLYPGQNGTLRLAYQVSIVPNLLESYYYLIDATSGEILTRISRQCSLLPADPQTAPVTISHFASVKNSDPLQVQSGFTDASATDLNGAATPLRTYLHSDNKYYAIWDLPSFNAGASALPDQPSGGALTLTLNNQDYTQNVSMFHNTSSNNSWSDRAVVSAHHNMLVTYNYYHSTFGRNAIDDKNSAIVSIIHVTQNGAGMDNAFWNGAGKVMIYGDGNTNFKPLAGGIDVAGHEMTHGVINNTADLVYQFQSGALNESLADVFGVMVDPRNLTIAEDVMQPGKGTCLRDMNDPHNSAGLSHQPATMSEFNNLNADQDNGGVHINSGIPNKACALLINQLGRDKVQKMYYRALTTYLTRNSQFTDCRIAVQSAAKDLFGASSAEFNAVGTAFDAVGITGPGTNQNQNDIPAQTGGTSLIAFTDDAGEIGLLNPANGQATLAGTAGSTARVSDGGSSRAQLSAPRTGTDLWFISPTGHLNFMDVSSGTVKTFTNLHIQEDGDLWNAAVSPDESYVALTSSYTNDPNIYIFDGKDIFIQPLKPENTDGGSVASIDYPDVISWSPNKSVPRISFDALLDAQVGGTPISYWSMYEINFDSKKIYDLIPAQPSDIDIGNVSYSNTSPDVIAFNVISGGVEDVALADFKTNSISTLNASQYSIVVPITDADKPSFSPTDHQFAFSSALNDAIVYYDGDDAVNHVKYFPFTASVFMPYWFLIGGSAGVGNDNYSEAPALAVYPSIASAMATAKFTLTATETVTLDIVNLYGQTVRPIEKNRMDAGTHEIPFHTDGLASGTYFVRLVTKQGQRMEKIVIER